MQKGKNAKRQKCKNAKMQKSKREKCKKAKMQKDKNAKRQKDALHAHTLQEHILTFSRQAPHWFMLQAMYYIENPTMVSKRACLDFCRQDQLRPPCEASLGLAVIWQRLSAHFAQLCSVYNLHILHSLLEDTWQIHCAHHADYGCFICTFLHGLRISSSVQR